MFKSIFLPIIAVAGFIILVGLLSQGKLIKVKAKSIKIDTTEINIEIAKTNDERSKGLSNRTSLNENTGMIFVFPKNSKPVFWMKDTKIPLDIIWINDNKIIGIDKNVEPELGIVDIKLKKYPAPDDVDYVLEVNAGFSDKNNIKLDQTISGLEQL